MVKSGKMIENGSNVVGDSFSFRMIIFANEIPDIILGLSLIVFFCLFVSTLQMNILGPAIF